jgi:Asp-tRNA(Asn)/Glu-tRNA(Gln) amidotransferase A subunit family amidase
MNVDTELLFSSATHIAARVNQRQTSATEVVQAFLDRVQAVNPRVNAIVTLTEELALRQARAIDDNVHSGVGGGPLAGVPFTVKDLVAVAGVRATGGSLLLNDWVPRASAPAIQRLQQAGAIFLGKSNCPEFGLELHTTNRVFGDTWNPWNLSYTSGGSSGGDSAAVAAGCAAFGIGTDYGGSIRWPAQCTGLTSLRPTPGRVPATGQIPYSSSRALPPPNSMSLQSQLQMIAPLARYVEDLGILLEVMSGPDGRDAFAVPVALSDWKSVALSDLRCAWFETEGTFPVRADVASTVAAAACCLEDLGVRTVHVRPPGLDSAEALARAFRSADGMPDHWALARGREELLTGYVREWFAGMRQASVEEYRRLAAARDDLRVQVLEFMQDWSILLLPVASVPAFRTPLQDSYVVEGVDIPRQQLITCCRVISLLGLPAVIVPFGTSDEGLPLSVQIVGRPFAEPTILAVAAALQAAFGLWRTRDAMHPLLD